MAIATGTAILIGSALAAGAVAGSAQYTSTQEKKSQKSLLEAQADQVRAAEEKAKAADALALQTAQDEVKKRRRSQSNTILTTPLGSSNMAQTQKATLLGG